MAWEKNKRSSTPFYKPIKDRDRFIDLSNNTLELLNDSNKEISLYNGEMKIGRETIPVNIKDKEFQLPSGFYNFTSLNYEDVLMECVLPADEELFLLDTNKTIIEDFKNFLNTKDIYNKLKLRYKRSILLFGPPGTGKTTAISIILKKLEIKDLICIWTDKPISHAIKEELEKDSRLKIIIFEEITELIEKRTKYFLDFLDGSTSMSNCFIVATTNYPELLPGNLLDRPGRFDLLIKVGYPSIKDVNKYSNYFINRNLTDSEHLNMRYMSLAHLKEVFLIHLKEGLSIEEAVLRLNKHKQLAKENFSERRIGFTRDYDED